MNINVCMCEEGSALVIKYQRNLLHSGAQEVNSSTYWTEGDRKARGKLIVSYTQQIGNKLLAGVAVSCSPSFHSHGPIVNSLLSSLDESIKLKVGGAFYLESLGSLIHSQLSYDRGRSQRLTLKLEKQLHNCLNVFVSSCLSRDSSSSANTSLRVGIGFSLSNII